MKKVIYICPNGFIGGAERFVLNACQGHLAYGYWEPVLIFFNDGVAVEEAKKIGIETHVLQQKFKLSNPITLIKALCELRGFIKNLNAQAIHATMPYGLIVSKLATMGLNIPTLWFQHGPVNGTLDFIANQFKVESVAFNSTYLQELHNRTPKIFFKSHSQKVINLGINLKAVDSIKVEEIRNTYCKGDELLFLAVGRITKCKGFDLILRAFNKLEVKNKTRLLIVGDVTRESDQAYANTLDQFIKDNDMQKIVSRVPFNDHIQNFYSAADCFIFSSTIPEPFGLTLAEAMLSETLVLGDNQGGAKDLLVHKQTGLCFDATKPDSFVDLANLVKTVVNGGIEQSIIINAKKRVSEQYSVQQMIENLEDMYSTQL